MSAIWIMRADGTHQERLTAPVLRAGGPSRPSQGRIAFDDNGNSPSSMGNSLFTMNVDGTDVLPLTQPMGSTHDVGANYSPDGSRIVFASDRMSSDTSLDIFTIKPDGSDMKRIATGLTLGGCPDDGCVCPTWGRKP